MFELFFVVRRWLALVRKPVEELGREFKCLIFINAVKPLLCRLGAAADRNRTC